jgi:transcriptional regulator with XRE-family HTH domain
VEELAMAKLEEVVKKRLKAIRENLKLNQSQFADQLGISQAAISQFEDGKRVPSIETLDKIAKSLGMSVVSLLSDDNAIDDEKARLMQDLTAQLVTMNNQELQAMNRFVVDWKKAKEEK